MDNRRTATRKHTVFHSKVFEAQSGEIVGYMVDVSTLGIRVMAPESMEPGQTLVLKLELPRALFGKETLSVEALVRWCRPDINPEYWAIGFELVEPTDESSVILGALQGTLCFEH